MNSGLDLKGLPAAERLKRLYQLHNRRDFDAIARLDSAHIASAPTPEALIVANAFYQIGNCGQALAALSQRDIEERFADRHINLLLGLARRAQDWRALIAVCKIALRRDPARAELFGYLATALRRLRRTRDVARLCAHVVWRYRQGRLPLTLFFDILRAMRRRRAALEFEADLGSGTEKAARIAFIELLIELSRFDRASALMAQWCIAPSELSPDAREAMTYLGERCQAFGVASFADLRAAVFDGLAGTAAPARRPPGAPRRILLTASSLGIGGSERQLSYLVDGLARQPDRAEAIIYCQTAEGHHRKTYAMAAPVYHVEGSGMANINPEPIGALPATLQRDLHFAFGTETIADICRLAAWFKPDVIYCAVGLPTEALIVAQLMATPVVVVRFGGESFYNNFDHSDDNERRIEVAEFCCRASRDVARFITNSQFARTIWARRLNMAPSAIAVITNGVPEPDVTAAEIPDSKGWGLPEAAFVIGWVGRFHDIKLPSLWLDIALAVARRHAQVRFLMIGDGPLRAAAEARIARHGLSRRFVFTGVVSGSLASCYRRMDVLLQTSRTESFPNVILEALSHGIPVIAHSVGDIARILVDERLGRAVDGDAPAAYVDAIDQALAARHTSAEAAAFRRLHVRSCYGIDAMYKAYVSMFGMAAPEGGPIGKMWPFLGPGKMT